MRNSEPPTGFGSATKWTDLAQRLGQISDQPLIRLAQMPLKNSVLCAWNHSRLLFFANWRRSEKSAG